MLFISCTQSIGFSAFICSFTPRLSHLLHGAKASSSPSARSRADDCSAGTASAAVCSFLCSFRYRSRGSRTLRLYAHQAFQSGYSIPFCALGQIQSVHILFPPVQVLFFVSVLLYSFSLFSSKVRFSSRSFDRALNLCRHTSEISCVALLSRLMVSAVL